MKPPPFEYFAPGTVEAAIAMMVEFGDDAALLAGGQSLVPMLNFRIAAPGALIDLNGIRSLGDISTENGLSLGAMTRTRRIETDPRIAAANPLLAAAAANVAHVQIRNRGTIGGSLAHADPAAEMPGVVLACDAEIRITGRGGSRSVPAEAFFHGILSTDVGDGEMITEIVFPEWPAARRWGFREVSRREGDFAMVGIAAWYDLDTEGKIAEARLSAIGAGDTPLRLRTREDLLRDEVPSQGLFRTVAIAAASDLQPGSDIHASAEYRREVGSVLINRVLSDAMERAG